MLQGCTVLDATERLGWLAGRLLADLGAQVTKLEAPGADLGGAEWRALNVNKHLVRLDPSRGARLLAGPAGPGWARPEALRGLRRCGRRSAAARRRRGGSGADRGIAAQLFAIQTSTPERFGELIRRDLERWSKLVKDANIKGD